MHIYDKIQKRSAYANFFEDIRIWLSNVKYFKNIQEEK